VRPERGMLAVGMPSYGISVFLIHSSESVSWIFLFFFS
jgi:hypothetical protein